MLLIQLLPSHPINVVGKLLQVFGRVAQFIHIPYLAGKSSLLGCVPPADMVDSEYVVGIKPGDSAVMIGYQVEEFTHTW